MTPSDETMIEDKEAIIDQSMLKEDPEGYKDIDADELFAEKQKEMDAAFREQVQKMSLEELVQLHRIAGGKFIYDATEQAIYDTATAVVIPSKIKRFCGERLAEMRPPNRAERRIMISRARRKERQELRAKRRQKGLYFATPFFGE
ncbi:MAG: hypothetical protein NXH70_02710 [Hyphomonas sp.]|nr:hypothetical protein [Hyphomonas sp.]